MNMRKGLVTGAFAAVILAGVPGLAPGSAMAENMNGALLASACNVCHGQGGHSEGHIPSIDGLSAQMISQRLVEFRDGKRPATIMKKIAMGYSDAQLKLIADEIGTK